ncbi:MAG: hypothetical protein IKU11_10740 [Clostridia bacterium]|nr:hypothetical protein [Clostridia bacterium]
MKKFLRIFATAFVFLFFTSIPATAEEMGAFAGTFERVRWTWTYVNANGDVTKCRLKLAEDELDISVLEGFYPNP